MFLGDQVPYNEEYLRFVRQMGVTHIDLFSVPNLGLEQDGYWHTDALLRARSLPKNKALFWQPCTCPSVRPASNTRYGRILCWALQNAIGISRR